MSQRHKDVLKAQDVLQKQYVLETQGFLLFSKHKHVVKDTLCPIHTVMYICVYTYTYQHIIRACFYLSHSLLSPFLLTRSRQQR